MAAKTLQQIRNQVLDKLTESDSNTHFTDQTVLNGYINEAVEFVGVFIEYPRDLVNVTTELDTPDYTVPSDTSFIRTAYFGDNTISGDVRPIKIVREETLRDMFPSWLDSTTQSQGRPNYLIFKNKKTITLFPRPDSINAGKKLFLNYNYSPASMSNDSDTPDIPLPYHNIVQYFALSLCYIRLNNPAMSAAMRKLFDDDVKAIKSTVTKESNEGLGFQWGNDVDVDIGTNYNLNF